MIEKLRTPVGRIVWGHPMKPRIKTNQETRATILDKDGKPVQQWKFGVAFSKADFQQIYAAMAAEAKTAYPNGTPQKFSWKFSDGDGVDSNGKPFNLRTGYAGCYVLTISTETFAPPVFKYEQGAYRQLTHENEIKCGDFVALNLNLKVNVPTSPTHTPGLYVNPNGIELVAYGEEIVSAGGDPNELFGGSQYQLPAGASLTPISSAPAGVPMPGMPTSVAPAYPAIAAPQPQGYPQQQYQPQVPQAPQQPQLPPPAHDFVQNAGMPQPVQMPGYPQQMPSAPQQQYQPQPVAPVQPQQQYQPQVPQAGFPQPVAPIAQPMPQQPMMQQGGYGAAPAPISYPSNGMPGMPPQR